MFEVVCHDEHGNVIHSLTQWDMNQTLRISWSMSEVPVIHFCNRKSEESLTVQCTKNGNNLVAQVPNILLQEPYPIIGYIYLYGNHQDSRTIYAFEIPVRKRVKPNDYIYEDDNNYVSVKELETNVNSLLSSVVALQTEVSQAATLNSPAFTGTPTAPTASPLTNNTQIATTSFVHGVKSLLENQLRVEWEQYIDDSIATAYGVANNTYALKTYVDEMIGNVEAALGALL